MSKSRTGDKQQDWDYKKYMFAKHEILRKYIGIWINILLSWNNHIIYIDGFSGKGKFDSGEKGSPVLVLEKASSILKKRNNKRFTAYFIEKDEDNYKFLLEELSSLNLIDRVDFQVINEKFEVFFKDFKDVIEAIEHKIRPIFFFLDPFGYSPITLDDLKFILSLDTTEFLLTFMYRDLNRFIETDHLKETRLKFLGREDFTSLLNIADTPNEREKIIVNDYRNQISSHVKAKYSSFFCVKKESSFKAPTFYYLIHASNHFKGLKIMKEVMYSVGGESYTYYGSLKKTTLEEILGTFKEQIGRYLMDNFPKNKFLEYQDIMKIIYQETPYIEKHFRNTLKELEKQGKIQVRRMVSKKTGIKKGDLFKIL